MDATLLDPLFVTLALLLGSTVLLYRRRDRVGRAPLVLTVAAFLILGGASYRPLAVGLLELLEGGQAPLDPAAASTPDAILVLGAGVREARTPRPVISPAGSERLLEGVRLARAWPSATLVFSGGSGVRDGTTSGEVMAARALEAGIEPDRVLVDATARTTRGNATGSAALAREHGWTHLVMVTSAGHMPRALAAFRKEGLDPTPAPCDFTGPGDAGDWVTPDIRSTADTQRFVHEVVGRVWYWLRGWA